jgi:ribosomal protein S18 acetylase RimI-like enzyme
MRLRPMTGTEFDQWRERLVVEFAAEQVRAGTWSEDDAEQLSEADLRSTLPEGADTAGMLLLIAEDDAGRVGVLWLSLIHPRGAPDTAWIYDIEVVPERRGQGLGRALLAEAEREIRERGVSALALNVFGDNATARNLYSSSDYQVTTQQMRKQL